MIDEATKIIYVDNSTLGMFESCKEKTRLASLLGYRSRVRSAALDFGHAFHAAWEAYYDAKAGGFHDAGAWVKFPAGDTTTPLVRAQAAFLRDLQFHDAVLPVNLESTERRSIERGLALVEAYISRYANELYENILRPDGSPHTEVGFRYYITKYGDYEIWYVGYIDRIMRSLATKRPVMIEGKTGTIGPDQYVQHAKPNNQVTGYFPAAQMLFPDLRECIWDYVFISTRKPDLDKSLLDRFWMYGIDIKHDFTRHHTTRSTADITRFRVDLEERALLYVQYLMSGKATWPMTAPFPCNAYGGCAFRERCNLNLDGESEKAYMDGKYVIERWEPWRKIAKQLEDPKSLLEPTLE